jgi:hypothetical protein
LNTFQEQSLVLALVCFAASLFFFGVMRSSRNTWFSGVIAMNLLALALIFGTFAIIKVYGERTEIAVALISELPFGAVVACLCVAQAGYLPRRIGGPPLAVVAARPRLRLLLASAGFVLPAAWMLAAIFGFMWPSSAVQALAPAPVEFVVFKWMLMAPAAFFAGFAAVLFLSAAGSGSLDMRLRLKNAAFALATFCLALVALESAVFAGVRVWLPYEARVTAISFLLAVETFLAVACVSAFILGVTLRYTPAIAAPLVRHVATRWLPEQDRFDSHRWRAVVGGVTRGVVSASYRIGVAAEHLGLSQLDAEHAVGTVQHIAAMCDSISDVATVTPESAHDLHTLQSAVVKDAGLIRKLGRIKSHDITSHFGAGHAASLHLELEAALDLMDHAPIKRDGRDNRPLWFYLAAVGASDVGLIEASRVKVALGDRIEYDRALEAYSKATSSSRESSRSYQHHRRSPKAPI